MKLVPGGLTTLGTDGFGRSDTRERLRRFFEIDLAQSPLIQIPGFEMGFAQLLEASANRLQTRMEASSAPWLSSKKLSTD